MILGGGISGLYITHELLKHNPDRNLVLLEKYKLGGNIFTYKDKNMISQGNESYTVRY